MPQVSLPGGPHTATDAMGCETGKSNAQNLESRAHSGRAPVETSGLSGFFSRISMMGHRGHSSQARLAFMLLTHPSTSMQNLVEPARLM